MNRVTGSCRHRARVQASPQQFRFLKFAEPEWRSAVSRTSAPPPPHCAANPQDRGCLRVEHDRSARHTWIDLLEQLEPLLPERRLHIAEAGEIAAWMREAGNEALGHRFGDSCEYNRYRIGRLLECPDRWCGSGQKHIGRQSH